MSLPKKPRRIGMSKMTKMVAAGLTLLAAGAVQADVVWNDSFDGASLNPNLSVNVSAQGSVTQTGGQLQMFVSDNGNVQRAMVATSNGQNGETQFNNAALYDFNDHQVSLRFDIASFTGSPSTGPNYNAFETGVGALNPSAGISEGVRVTLAKRNDGVSDYYRFELAGFGATIYPTINGLPTAFEYDLNGNSLTLRVEGTTFTTTSSDTYSWTFTSGTASSYNLMYGAFNAGTPLTGTQVTLDSFEVQAIPEPVTLGLFSISGAVILLGRRALTL
jgi:hypothetical protein